MGAMVLSRQLIPRALGTPNSSPVAATRVSTRRQQAYPPGGKVFFAILSGTSGSCRQVATFATISTLKFFTGGHETGGLEVNTGTRKKQARLLHEGQGAGIAACSAGGVT